MSRVHRFRGSIDAPEPGAKHVVGMVFGLDPHTPQFGFVRIDLSSFPADIRDSLRDGDEVEGRYCPRSCRVWVTKRRPLRKVTLGQADVYVEGKKIAEATDVEFEMSVGEPPVAAEKARRAAAKV